MPLRLTPADLSISSARLPFQEQIAFFRQKLNLPTRTWRDVWREQHDRAFVVAGAMKADLLADLAGAVDRAISEGRGLDAFRREFRDIVQRHGWHDYTGAGSDAGRAWRTRVIYQTNVATSYAAGRLAQLRASGLPYWMYKHSDSVTHPRPLHLSWDGLTLPADHEWFKTHGPPNGWGCQCRLVAVSARTAKRLGGRVTDTPPDNGTTPTGRPNGIDAGWDYLPGDTVSDRIRGLIPELVDRPPSGRSVLPAPLCPVRGRRDFAERDCPGPLPQPRPFDPARLLPDGKSAQWYVEAFLDQFGASIDKPVRITDLSGESLLISAALFEDRARSARAGQTIYKAMKGGRHRYLPMLAETIKSPQEIWDAWEWVGARDEMARRGRYLAWWDMGRRHDTGLAVFEWVDKRWWSGVTTFVPDPESADDLAAYVAAQRSGIRRWPK